MHGEIHTLDPAWYAWLAANPGYEMTNTEERGDRGDRFLPVYFAESGWEGLAVRRPDGSVTVYWRG